MRKREAIILSNTVRWTPTISLGESRRSPYRMGEYARTYNETLGGMSIERDYLLGLRAATPVDARQEFDFMLGAGGFKITDEHKEVIDICFAGRQHELYRRYKIPKKGGGFRDIEEPCNELKQIQKYLLELFIPLFRLHKSSFGFRKGISIANNAQRHITGSEGTRFLAKIDLCDFFPSISGNCVFDGMISNFMYMSMRTSPWVYFTPEHPKAFKTGLRGRLLDGQATRDAYTGRFLGACLGVMYVCTLFDRLPQGAPTSPALSNICMWRVDSILSKKARQNGIIYTRYADDLAMSSGGLAPLRRFIGISKGVLASFGFDVNEEKTKLVKQGLPMRVTGVNINSGRPTVSRYKRKALEAQMFNLVNKKHTEVAGQRSKIHGNMAFMRMVMRDAPSMKKLYCLQGKLSTAK